MERSISNGLFWKLLERGGVQLVQFIIQIILARLLSPNDYGTIALVSIFIAISNVFVESGFSLAILQKKNYSDQDANTAFTISLIISIIIYVFLFVFAPFISNIYNNNSLILIIRILSITLIIGALNSVQVAVVSKEFAFKALFRLSVISVTISGIIGIVLAYLGFGVWSLVFQQLIMKLMSTVLFYFTLNWKPQFQYNSNSMLSLYHFGSKILISNLISTIYTNLYGLIIGKLYSSKLLGYYNRADQFPNVIAVNLSSSLQSVLLPAMSTYQDNKTQLIYILRKTISSIYFFIFPMMIGILLCANEIIVVLLTDKWIAAVPFLQLLCLYYLMTPLQSLNLQAINSIGRSDIYLKLEIINRLIETLGLIISIPFGIYVLIYSKVITNFITTFFTILPNKKIFNYKYLDFILDILPSLISTVLMAFGVSIISYFFYQSNLLTLLFKILLGIVLYCFFSFLFNKNIFKYYFKKLINTLKKER